MRALAPDTLFFGFLLIARIAALVSSMMMLAVTVVPACVTRVPEPAPAPIVIEVPMMPMVPDPEVRIDPCSRRDHIVLLTDSGVIEFDVPRPCNTNKYRELGDPQP